MAQEEDVFDEQVAAHYEAWYETPEGRRADALEKDALSWLLRQFSPPESILDIGCGTGHFTTWLSRQGFWAVGLDRSAPMVAQGRTLVSGPLVRGDAVRLPFADGAFDLTALITTLEFLERPREGIAEALRVARLGVLLGVLNRWSVLGIWRRLVGLFRPTVYDAGRFYGVGELKQLLRTVSGGWGRIVWRTTLFPRWLPWRRATVPWGGLIAIALVREEGG